MNTTPRKTPTPAEALGWTLVAFLIWMVAYTTGQYVGYPTESGMAWTVKGLLVLLASGYAGSLVTGWFSKAIRGQ